MEMLAEFWEAFGNALREFAEMFCDNIEDFEQSVKDIADLMERLPKDTPTDDRAQPVRRQRPGGPAHGHTVIPSRMRRYTAATGG